MMCTYSYNSTERAATGIFVKKDEKVPKNLNKKRLPTTNYCGYAIIH